MKFSICNCWFPSGWVHRLGKCGLKWSIHDTLEGMPAPSRELDGFHEGIKLWQHEGDWFSIYSHAASSAFCDWIL